MSFAACSDSGPPPKLEAYAYPETHSSAPCEPGSLSGLAGAIDDEISADGILYNVRTPSNYKATVGHPLLMVYAPAGQSRRSSEQLTGLTSAATAAGLVVVYADHRPLGIPVIEQFGKIPDQVAKKWCIDRKKVYITGHSDGGTVSMALAVLDRTRPCLLGSLRAPPD